MVLLNDDIDPIVRRTVEAVVRWVLIAEAKATVLLFDGFAVLDCERHDIDSTSWAAMAATGST
jgi:hypothetical protein